MQEHVQVALECIKQQIQELERIHRQVNESLNAVLGKEHLQKWKTQTLALLTQKVGPEQTSQFSKDWLETPFFGADIFEELSGDVEMCRRHLRRLAKDIEKSGLPAPSSQLPQHS